MNAALFVGQSAANMRLPPCCDSLITNIKTKFSKNRTSKLEVLHLFRCSTHTHSSLDYTNYTTPQPQLQLQLHHYTNYITIRYNDNSFTPQLQLQLHYTTLHPAVVGEVTTATIATAPKNTTSTTFRSISGFALPSMVHASQQLTSPVASFP